jgi:hypothetical protein
LTGAEMLVVVVVGAVEDPEEIADESLLVAAPRSRHGGDFEEIRLDLRELMKKWTDGVCQSGGERMAGRKKWGLCFSRFLPRVLLDSNAHGPQDELTSKYVEWMSTSRCAYKAWTQHFRPSSQARIAYHQLYFHSALSRVPPTSQSHPP